MYQSMHVVVGPICPFVRALVPSQLTKLAIASLSGASPLGLLDLHLSHLHGTGPTWIECVC